MAEKETNVLNETEIANKVEPTLASNIVRLPMMAVRGKVIFPNVYTTIDIGRIKSLNAVNTALKGDKLLLCLTQKDSAVESPELSDLYEIGTVVKVGTIGKVSTDNFRVTIEGLYRVKVLCEYKEHDYFYVDAEKLESETGNAVETEAYLRVVKDSFKENFASYFKSNRDTFASIYNMLDADNFINAATFNLKFKEAEKQEILEITNVLTRLEKFAVMLSVENEIAKTQKIITEKVKESVETNQKEFYLREQLKAIHEELGDDEEKEHELLLRQIKEKGLDAESEEKVLKELNRMSRMNTASPDYTVIRSYLDWIIDLPFNKESVDTELLSECTRMLEEDHFGLEKVKQRIVEYLAVLKLTKSLRGPILCLVGPPGVGKTSIAKSVARALNRKLVRMSLGGVKDEAEIRGHRKTYIGAMPGRIIYGMKESGTINPVFLLDEIDKLSSDLRGDPASALLEVLDPEQNPTFRDRYLEIPYDLSKVMFITTANSTDTIPAPLLDRMEVIEIAGYTLEEKIQIAKRYLVPKQAKLNGLTSKNVAFTDGGIRAVIEGYTAEAGVRKLEQKIAEVCRKIATVYADNKNYPKQTVTKTHVTEFLGALKYLGDEIDFKDEIGSATGLAYTTLGGAALTIEVATMKGKGNLSLTGKLGEVMQESAKAAITYIRSHAEELGVNAEIFEKTDIHVHVPEGAVPKDGPSAGITLATAIYSALTGKKVKRNIAMTGEITLRGTVLAIGGVKEKALAAYRLGIKTIIIPKKNEKDLEELPAEIRGKIKFIGVSNVKKVFDTVLN
ncbi:MAG: endopeptidase La [Clostridia bacterium]|nr:endopeptidase La [Clostridia bacterium]